MAVDRGDPVGKCGEPVVVVAVEDQPGFARYATPAHELTPRLLRWDIAADAVAQFGGPIDAAGAGEVAAVVGSGIDVDFEQSHIGIVQVIGHPVR